MSPTLAESQKSSSQTISLIPISPVEHCSAAVTITNSFEKKHLVNKNRLKYKDKRYHEARAKNEVCSSKEIKETASRKK